MIDLLPLTDADRIRLAKRKRYAVDAFGRGALYCTMGAVGDDDEAPICGRLAVVLLLPGHCAIRDDGSVDTAAWDGQCACREHANAVDPRHLVGG